MADTLILEEGITKGLIKTQKLRLKGRLNLILSELGLTQKEEIGIR